MIHWRWDQGRLIYLQFDVIKQMAEALVQFDGVDVRRDEAGFRKVLESKTCLPFAPSDYTIRRNYSRVFQSTFLANFIGNRNESKLVVTDFCKELANPRGKIQNVDDFFINYMKRFRYPFPAFDNFSATSIIVYPFIAILKYLIAQSEMSVEFPKISPDEVLTYLVANDCTGLESIDYYKTLSPKRYVRQGGDDERQVREMMAFFSQLSFLKDHKSNLYLDVDNQNKEEIKINYLNPIINIPKNDKTEDFYSITRLEESRITIPTFTLIPTHLLGIEIQEGDRKRTEHFKIERSPLLRRYYKEAYPQPICCACHQNMAKVYNWTDYMLDIHHLLPLSSSIRLTKNGSTSIEDLVGLCPSCHSAIHLYYNKWLK